MSCKAKICRGILRVFGWTAVEPLPPEDKCIILGVPHTTVWDFFVSWLYYASIGGEAKCMVKKEFFFPPVGWLLRAMGAIPVDRSSPTKLVRSVIREMESAKVFHLAIAPEGTRKPVRHWKTGFHFIARQAGVPVYMGYFDWKTKRVGRGERVELTDDARADMQRIQARYEQKHLVGKHPERDVTH